MGILGEMAALFVAEKALGAIDTREKKHISKENRVHRNTVAVQLFFLRRNKSIKIVTPDGEILYEATLPFQLSSRYSKKHYHVKLLDANDNTIGRIDSDWFSSNSYSIHVGDKQIADVKVSFSFKGKFAVNGLNWRIAGRASFGSNYVFTDEDEHPVAQFSDFEHYPNDIDSLPAKYNASGSYVMDIYDTQDELACIMLGLLMIIHENRVGC